MNSKKQTILLVEDEAVIAIAQKKSLEKYGYKVISSNTGEKALEIFKSNKIIDLILMDIDLGRGIDGTDTARAMLEYRNVPIMFLSSHTEPEIVKKTEKITSYGYVVKNSGITVLDASIKMAFKLFHANTKITDSETRFRSYFDLPLHGVAITSPAKEWIEVNDTLCLMLGYTKEELKNMAWVDITHPDDIAADIEMFNRIMSGETEYYFLDKRFIRKDGRFIWTRLSAGCVRKSDRSVDYFIAILEDITDRKNIEENLNRNLYNLNERNKELNCLYSISELVRRPDISLEEILKESSVILVQSYQYPEVTACRIILYNIEGKTANFRETGWQQTSVIKIHSITEGKIEVHYLEERPSEYDGPFLAGERKLLNAVAELIGRSTERKQGEELLKNTLLFQQKLLEAIPLPVFYKDEECKFKGGNKAFEKFLGLLPESYIGKTVNEISQPALAENYTRADMDLLNNPGIQIYEEQVIDAEEFPHNVIFHKATFTNNKDKTAGIIGVMYDITERKMFEKQLEFQQNLLSIIMNSKTDTIIFSLDKNYCYTAFNEKHREEMKLVWNADIRIGMNLPDCMKLPDLRELARKSMDRALNGESFSEIQHQPELDIYYEFNWRPVIQKNEITGIIVFIENITRHRQTEELLKLEEGRLKHNELILREVHHRFNNFMNSIKGLLLLQADLQEDRSVASVLENTITRIDGMSLLYDKLYRQDNFDGKSVTEYIPALADEIILNFPNSNNVRILKNIGDFVLSKKLLQPVGIIINELLTNIMKHAFPGGRSGLIKISLLLQNKRVTLVVQDNGIGIPESINFENSTGFGMQLVSMLVGQIDGHIRVERGEGTKFVLEFDT